MSDRDDFLNNENNGKKYRSIKEVIEEQKRNNGTAEFNDFEGYSAEPTTEPLKEEPLTINNDTFTERHEEPKACFTENYKKPKKNKNSFGRFVAALLIVSIAGGASIGAGYGAIKYRTLGTSAEKETSGSLTVVPSSAIGVASNTSDSAISVIDRVFPSVVNISTSAVTQQNYYGYIVPYQYNSAGSGIIFSDDDTKVYIATNYHVIDGATSVSVAVTDGDSVSASVVGRDSESDLAVISVLKSDLESAGIDTITIAEFGDSDTLSVGENVIAIGNALGEGKVATGGMVSSKLKSITIDGNTLSVIQTDSAINPGNSGGALVNYAGQVIGINTAKSSSSQIEGMGYAIPSNIALPILNTLLEDGTIPKPYIGIMGMDVTDDLADKYGLPIGVYISQVLENSGAAAAGLQEGDIITDFNGEKIMNMEKLIETISDLNVGDTVDIRVIRNGDETIETQITISDANNL